MAFFAFLSFFAADSGGFNAVLLFSALGGLSGLAALATVYVNYRNNQRRAVVDDKSVAITELEKAVPGLGDIIEQWQAVVQQLQLDLSGTRADLEACRKRLSELEGGRNA